MNLVGSFAQGVGAGLAPHAVAQIVGAAPTPTTLEAREVAAQATLARYGGQPTIPWVWIVVAVGAGFVAVQALASPKRERARRGDTLREIA
jgi:hypothetical protein